MHYDGYDVYEKYIALKTHFHGTYDYFKYNGKIRTNYRAYERRNDRAFFSLVAKRVPQREIVPFLVANFINNEDVWIGNLIEDYDGAHKIYTEWKKKMFSLYKIYEDDLDNIIEFVQERSVDIQSVFVYNDADHPMIFRFMIQKMIEKETFILLDNVIHFINKLDKKLCGDIIWDKEIMRINKYRSFIRYDQDKIRDITVSKFKTII